MARVGETEGAEELVLEVVPTVEDVLGWTEDVLEGFVELVVGTLEGLVVGMLAAPELFELVDLLVLEDAEVAGFEELAVEDFVEEKDETVEVVEVFDVLTGDTVEDFVGLVVGTDEEDALVEPVVTGTDELVEDLVELVVEEIVVYGGKLTRLL